MKTDWLFVTLLRAILALHPPGYRRQFGTDVLDTARDTCRRAQPHGTFAATRAVLAGLADACLSLVLEWLAVVASVLAPGPVGLDVRLALRALRARPLVSAAIVMTLALGIGASAAVFTVVDAVLLRPVPVSDPSTVVSIVDSSRPDAPPDGVPYPTYRDLARSATTVTALAGFHDLDVHLEADGLAMQTRIGVVTGRYFDVLGLTPAIGRLFRADDERAALASPYVVLSDGLWRELYNRDPHVLGRSLRLGDTVFSVIGVAPPGFHGTDLSSRVRAWVPVTMMQGLSVGGMFSGRFSQNLLTTFRGLGWLSLIGRRQAGTEVDAVATEFTTLLAAVTPARAASANPAPARSMTAMPLVVAATGADRPGLVSFLELLMALVGLVLLLACANVANLLLARAAERDRELGMCVALGATRGRLVRRLFTESICYGLASGAVGLAIAVMMLRLLSAFMLPGDIRLDSLDLTLDLRLVGWSVGGALLTTVLFGVWPAVRVSRVAPLQAFAANVRSTSGAGPRPILVGAQVAISLVILVTAGLFLRSLIAGLQTNLGFSYEQVGAVTVETRLRGLTTPATRRFYVEVVERLRHTPGITSAAIGSHVPVSPTFSMGLRARESGATAEALQVGRNFVTNGYFETLGIPFLAGHDFPPVEPAAGAPQPVIVNASAARGLWGTTAAVGRVVLDELGREAVIIGVVADTRQATLAGSSEPVVFHWILGEVVSGKVQVIARGASADQARDAVRAALSSVDSTIPHVNPRVMADHIDVVLMPQRLGATLLGLFGVIATAVAGLGLYAAFAHAVATRHAEIGIRLALGGSPARVLQGIGQHLVRATGIGVAAGLAGSAIIASAAERFLFGISTFDTPAFAAGLLVIAVVTCIVSIAALRQALSVNILGVLGER